MIEKLLKNVYFFMFFGISSIAGMLIPFLASKGFEPIEIGTLISLFTLSGLVSQLSTGYFCDKFRTIRKILLPVLISTIISGAISILSDTGIIFYISFFTLGLFSSVLASLLDSFVMESNENIKSKFGKLRSFASVGWSLGVLSTGFIASIFGYDVVSLVFISTLIISTFIIFKLEDVTKECNDNITFKPLIINKRYDFTIITLLFICIAFRCYYQLVPYTIASLGGNASSIGIYYFIASLSEIIILVLLNKIMHKISPDKILVIVPIVLLIQLSILYFTQNIIIIFISAILQMFTYPIILIVGRVMVDRISPINLKTTSQLIGFAIYNSIGIIIASFLVGFLLEYYGISNSIIFIVFLTVISFIMSFFYDKRTKDETL